MHLDIVSSQNYNLGWDCMSKSHMEKSLDLYEKISTVFILMKFDFTLINRRHKHLCYFMIWYSFCSQPHIHVYTIVGPCFDSVWGVTLITYQTWHSCFVLWGTCILLIYTYVLFAPAAI